MSENLRNRYSNEDSENEKENSQEAAVNLHNYSGSSDSMGILLSPKNRGEETIAAHLITPVAKHVKVHESLNFDKGDSQERQFSRYFIFIKILGRGAFGKVVMVKERASGLQYAVKIMRKNNVSADGMERLMSEAKILRELDHENIVKFSRVQESETKIFIVMELLLGGTLRQLMSEKKKNNEWFTEIEVAQIMHSILAGVAYFHSKSIVHRDIKPDNILIGDGRNLRTVKIADFGLSAAFEAKRSISFTEQCGTLIYMAPEFFIQKIFSKPIDIWSCGIIMYQLLDKGNHPFYDPKRHTPKTFKQLMRTSPRITFSHNFTEQTKILVQNMTLIDPLSRYTANQALTHPWIGQNPAAEVPLTMNEMLSSVNLQTTFLNMKKAVMFIVYLRKCANKFPQLSPAYKQKIKRFSLLKNKEKQNFRKIDIYSDQYLNSIIDLDCNNTNLNHSRSVISEDLIDSPTNKELLIPELPLNEIITFPQDKSLSSSPLPRSQILNNINLKFNEEKGLSAASISLYSSPAVHENLQTFHKKSSSFHKTTTQQSTGQLTHSSIRESTDSILNRTPKRYVSDQSPLSTPQNFQSTFNMQNDEETPFVDQQGGSISPRKHVVQMVPAKPQPNSSSPVKRTYNNVNTKINGIKQYSSLTKDDNNRQDGSSTKNNCGSQKGNYTNLTNYVHDDFSKRYEDHLKTRNWQTQAVSYSGTNKEQKGVVKDGFNNGSSCEGLLTPLESIDMQNKNNKNQVSIGCNRKNSSTYTSSCKTKQPYNSSSLNRNSSSRQQSNQETSEIQRIINSQKAQVAALQIPMRSLNLQSPPKMIPVQKNQISNYAKLTSNPDYCEIFQKEKNQNFEQILQKVQSSLPLYSRQDTFVDIKEQIESSSITIHKSLSSQRENSIKRDVLPVITPKKRESFSVGQKASPNTREKQFKQNNSAEIKKTNNISKNNNDKIYLNGMQNKRDSKGVLSPANMMMATMTTTTAGTPQNSTLISKYNTLSNQYVGQKKIIDNFQTNIVVLESKQKNQH